jgi:hypothetical protein
VVSLFLTCMEASRYKIYRELVCEEDWRVFPTLPLRFLRRSYCILFEKGKTAQVVIIP